VTRGIAWSTEPNRHALFAVRGGPRARHLPESKEIAELDVSEATVKAHVSAVMQKLGVSNRTQAVLLAQRLSLDQQ
jgi:hypothetical protein